MGKQTNKRREVTPWKMLLKVALKTKMEVRRTKGS